MVSQLQTNSATLDADITNLGTDLAALQDMARSLPVGATVPFDKRSVFTELEDRVNQQFDRLSYVLAMYEGETQF